MKKKIFTVLAACLAITVLAAGCSTAGAADATENPYEVLEGEPVMPTVTPEDQGIWVDPRPLYEDEVIEQAKSRISWEYYAVTAEQDPETRQWTVTFWSRDREKFQVVIVGEYGGILQVTEGMAWANGE